MVFIGMATIIVLIAILTSIYGRQSIRLFESSTRIRLVNAANAGVLVATAEELDQIQTMEDMDTALARDMKQRMIRFAETNDVLYIYYVRPGKGGMNYYIMDNDTDPDTSVNPEMEFSDDSASTQAFNGITASTQFGEYSDDVNILDVAAIANPDDTAYYLSGYAPIYDANGKLYCIVGVDILSETLINQNNAMMRLMLFQIVSAIFVLITGIVSTRIYRKRVAESMSASNSKSAFLSNMSHEMRTPMNTVIGMTQLALQNTIIEKKNEYLGKILTASDHLLGVINDVLDMSKIDADKMVLAHIPFSLKEVINRVKVVVSQAVDNKNQHFSISIDEAIPDWLIGDDQRFTQVITNIVSNAIKFTPEGGDISLHAKLGSQIESKLSNVEKSAFSNVERNTLSSAERIVLSKEGKNAKKQLCDGNKNENICRIHIDITDTGIGISPEQQKNLFQAFEQADKNISRKFGGTGLGLALSKRIVELMGGHIRLQSKLGHGSTFSFDCQFEISNTVPLSMRTDEKADNEPLDFTGHVILLAEDIEVNREIVLEVLMPTGITVLEAQNGEMAVSMFENNNIELILMDIQMPGIDGYEATRRIRTMSYKNSKTVPIIAMTANVFKEDIDLCIAAGMNEHLGKPIDFSQLLGVLKKYLK
jgi:signal transduction histidine kinase/CheY-like chemotaxis protein